MSAAAIIDGILVREGREFTDNPDDRGGPTKFGITLATLAAFRGHLVTAADVRALEEPEARNIYLRRYITDVGFDLILEVSEKVGDEVIDTGVNCGQEVAARFLQRALNVLNRAQALYPDLAVDGHVGSATVAALKSYLAHRREGVLLTALNALQGARYVELCEGREKNESFVYGWLANRVGLKEGG